MKCNPTKLTKALTVLTVLLASSYAIGQTIYKAPAAPTIDGTIDDVWHMAEAWPLTVRADNFDPADLSAYAKVLWDDDNLYYLVVVMDDEISEDSDMAWQDDSVEIYIDADNSKATSYDDNDAQLTIRRTFDDVLYGTNFAAYADRVTWMTQELEDGVGYVLEMAISLADWPTAVEDGMQIGIEIQINDDDDGGGGDGVIKLIAEGSSFRDPSVFGTATLSAKRAQSGIENVYKAPIAPEIDGDIDMVWKLIEPWDIKIRSQLYDPEDLSAQARVLWTDDHLYFLVEVTDDMIMEDSDLAWQDDSVEIYIDGDNAKATSYDGNDAQLTFRRTYDGIVHGSPGPYADKLTWTTKETANGYLIEGALSLADFAQTPANGVQIGFDIQINDDDTEGGSNDGYIKLFDVVGQAWRNPSNFGTVTLTSETAQGAILPIYKAPFAPLIDGMVDQLWDSIEGWDLVIRSNQYEPEDLSAQAKVLWDDDYLYYLVVVTDDVIMEDSDLAWQDDSVEIYIDADNSKLTTYGEYDNQITVRRTYDGVANLNAFYQDRVTWMTHELEGGGGYVLEMAISLANWPQPVAGGMKLGIEMQINDDDDGGDNDGYIKLITVGSSWRNPSLFGTAMLMDELAPTDILQIYKTPLAPEIDGAVDEIWDGVSGWDLTIRADQFEPEDLSAHAKVLWDDSNLYYLVTVMDNEISEDSDLAWQDDSVEIYVDADNSKGTAYDGNDAQITVRRTYDGILSGGNFAAYEDRLTWMTQEIEGGYVLEMAISLVDWPQAVEEGMLFGIEIQINDDDDGGDGDGVIKLITEGSSWRNPSLFGTARLTEKLIRIPGGLPLPWEEEGLEVGDEVFSPWFGNFEFGGNDWVRHSEMGWLYVGFVNYSDDMWLYSLYRNGWLWSTDSLFTVSYDYNAETWIWFIILEDIGAWVFDYSTGEWTLNP